MTLPSRTQLLDIAGASQTLAALRGSLRIVKLEREDTTLSERLLLALSMASHPSGEFVAEIHNLAKKQLKNERAYATLVASLGSVLRHALGNNARMKQAAEALKWLETRLVQCESEECKLTFLKALRNAAQASSIPVLLTHLKSASKKNRSRNAAGAARNRPHLLLA